MRQFDELVMLVIEEHKGLVSFMIGDVVCKQARVQTRIAQSLASKKRLFIITSEEFLIPHLGNNINLHHCHFNLQKVKLHLKFKKWVKLYLKNGLSYEYMKKAI